MRCAPRRSASSKYFFSLPGPQRLRRKRKSLLQELANEKCLAHLAQRDAQLFCLANRLHPAIDVRADFRLFLLQLVTGVPPVQHGSAEARRNVSDKYAGGNHAPAVWQHTRDRTFYYPLDQ